MDENTKSFSTTAEWYKWLDKNHDEPNGIWLRFYKKDSKIATVTHDEVLDEALCYGWIDYLEKFAKWKSAQIGYEHSKKLSRRKRNQKT